MTKKHNNQAGFGHIAIVLIIMVVAAICIVGWVVMHNNKPTATTSGTQDIKTSPNNSATSPTNSAEADMELHNLGVASFDSMIVSTNALREYKDKGLKGFYIFGDVLSGGRINPNFEYAAMKQGTPVISAIDGIVGFIKEQPESKDYEVFIQPKAGSKWIIGYDHLVNVKVQKDASVKVGDVLGEPSVQNNGQYRFEFQVNKGLNNDTAHICPTTLLAASVKDKWISELTALQDKWEAVSGYNLYDQAAQKPAGCLYNTLSPAQAEGRSNQ